MPAFADHAIAAEFVVPANGRLRVPVSDAEVVLHELSISPTPLREVFDGENRSFLFEPGSVVVLRTKLRVFGVDGRPPRPIAELLGEPHALQPTR
jgi:hypothetical protein